MTTRNFMTLKHIIQKIQKVMLLCTTILLVYEAMSRSSELYESLKVPLINLGEKSLTRRNKFLIQEICKNNVLL